MSKKLSMVDLDLKGKRVFIRVDYNVPLNQDLEITDDTRIRESLPTIRYVLEQGAAGVILASHLGRPKGKRDEKASLKPAAKKLEKLLGKPVQMAPDCIGPEVKKMADGLKGGGVLLLENLRFHEGETRDDPDFSKKLAELADVYVNDAFGSAHRAHASVSGITRYFARAAAGFLMEKEIEYLGKITTNPEKPFVAIMGGAKVSDKIEVIENLLNKVDTVLIGGGMAYTFLKAGGCDVGKSLVEEEKLQTAREVLEKARRRGVEIVLPRDNVVAGQPGDDVTVEIAPSGRIPRNEMALDIGPETVKAFTDRIKTARTIFWNGPMGYFEKKPFAGGTAAIARAVAETDCMSVIGGGDTVAALHQAGIEGKITHVSTGGGASLEFLSGKELPGIAALSEA